MKVRLLRRLRKKAFDRIRVEIEYDSIIGFYPVIYEYNWFGNIESVLLSKKNWEVCRNLSAWYAVRTANSKLKDYRNSYIVREVLELRKRFNKWK